jgi:hypothetical protein
VSQSLWVDFCSLIITKGLGLGLRGDSCIVWGEPNPQPPEIGYVDFVDERNWGWLPHFLPAPTHPHPEERRRKEKGREENKIEEKRGGEKKRRG